MSGLHKRKSLKSLLEEAKEKMTQAPEHIKAAQVLSEMQEDVRAKMSGVSVRGDRPGSLSGGDATEAEQEAPVSPPESPETTAQTPPRRKPVPFPIPEEYYKKQAVHQEQSDVSPDTHPEKCPGVTTGVDVRGICPGVLSGVPVRGQAAAPAEIPSEKKRPGRKSVREILPRRPRIVGERQKQVYAWLKEQGGAVRTTLSMLTEITGIEDRSLRRILTAWEANGIIQKTSGQFGVEMKLLIDEPPPAPRKAVSHAAQAPLSGVALADVCPSLCAAGFADVHLKRIMAALHTQGIDTGHVWAGLRYAEWELANGTMVDKTGGQISSPVDWVYKSLISDGTYRIPKGYLSPTEKLRRQAAEELAREREELEQLERLRAEKEELELQKQIEAMLAQVLADTTGELARSILEPLPRFLKELGVENPLFQRACRAQVEWHLKSLAGSDEK